MLSPHQIAALRKRMNISQAEMAALLGVASRLTVSQWENGFSTPGGPIMRFLSLLDDLSESELCKIMKRLEKLSHSQSTSKK